MRCKNCKVMHYGCLLVPVKEASKGKGSPSGLQCAKLVAGSQMKGQAKKGKGTKGVSFNSLILGTSFVSLPSVFC